MDFLPLVILVDYAVMLVCQSMGAMGFGYILYWRSKHKAFEMSYCMILYISAEFLFALWSIPHLAYLAVLWQSQDAKLQYNAYWIYITALPQTVLILIIPITVFFLGLDRCLCLWFPYKNRKLISKLVLLLALATVSVFTAINFYFYVIPAFPTAAPTFCRSSGCLASVESARVFSTLRYVASVSNVFIGLVLVKLVRKKIIAKNALTKKNNRLAIVTLLMALLLDFLPHLVNFTLTTFKDIYLTKYIGPYSLLFASINTSICAVTYYRTVRRQSSPSNSLNRVTHFLPRTTSTYK